MHVGEKSEIYFRLWGHAFMQELHYIYYNPDDDVDHA